MGRSSVQATKYFCSSPAYHVSLQCDKSAIAGIGHCSEDAGAEGQKTDMQVSVAIRSKSSTTFTTVAGIHLAALYLVGKPNGAGHHEQAFEALVKSPIKQTLLVRSYGTRNLIQVWSRCGGLEQCRSSVQSECHLQYRRKGYNINELG